MSHPVERKLRMELCPYLATAHCIDRWRPYWIYRVHAYFGDLCLALASIGLSNPLLSLLTPAAAVAATAPAEPAAQTPIDYLFSNELGVIGGVALVIWLVVKIYVHREDLEKRCSLITSYKRQSAQIELAVRNALTSANPIPELNALKLKLNDLVARNIAEGSFPDNVFNTYRLASEALCAQLVKDYSDSWEPAPSADQRPPPVRQPPFTGPSTPATDQPPQAGPATPDQPTRASAPAPAMDPPPQAGATMAATDPAREGQAAPATDHNPRGDLT